MALTDISTVLTVIQSEEIFVTDIENDEIKLTLFEDGQLTYGNITSGSEVVKIIRENEPVADSHNPLTLNDQTAVDLDPEYIVPDSVVVASDAILTTVYVENDDYIIDYSSGTVERTSLGSSIANGGTVHVWYIPFVCLTGGSDYNIDYGAGTIKRRAGSSIPNKATVYVDYNHSSTNPSDDLIRELIEEMEALIEPKLKGGYTLDSDDIGLKGAATNYVLYGYCLAASLKELKFGNKDESDHIAAEWRRLSKDYLMMARNMFSPYLAVSTQQLGGLIENRYTNGRKRTSLSPSVAVTRRRH